MQIKPRIKGFICLTAHPEGLAAEVKRQIDHVAGKPALKKERGTLIIGGSAGYGLASAITALYGADAPALALSFDRPAANERTATHGYYNLAALKSRAARDGLHLDVLLGDAFSNNAKKAAIERLRRSFGKIDRVVYSLAAPARIDPDSGERISSVIRPIGAPYKSKTLDVSKGRVLDVEVAPASDSEVANTVRVMGGEDWALWISALKEAGVLADGFRTVAYSYIGPALTHPIYRDGTIGRAKEHLETTAKSFSALGGDGYISVNKALVTQASSAIPVVPLYISILYAVMKERGLHEDCIAQIRRLYDKEQKNERDENGRFRLDDYELSTDVQNEVDRRFAAADDQNLESLSDLAGYREDFLRIFGFSVPGIDYDAETDADIKIDCAEMI